MKTYQCHKQVQAAKITAVIENHEKSGITLQLEGEPLSLEMKQEWADKHQPQVGGYFVQYSDGYQSFSPAAPFEEGYSMVEETAPAPQVDAPAEAGGDGPAEATDTEAKED